MITNKQMRKLIKDYEIFEEVEKIDLNAELEKIITSGIVKINECYFLQELLPKNFDFTIATMNAFDFTEIESEINHIHINDYIIQHELEFPYVITQSVKYALSLKQILPENIKYKIIFSCSFDPICDCNVRFYKQREDENWIADDIEKYEEAVMILE